MNALTGFQPDTLTTTAQSTRTARHKRKRAPEVGSATRLAPDADLIAECDQFLLLHRQAVAIYDGPHAIEDEDEADAAFDVCVVPLRASLDRLEALTATTTDGLAARARCLAGYDAKGDLSYDERATNPRRLLLALLRDGAAMTGKATPNPDAELLALRPEFDRQHAIMVAYNNNLIPDGGTEGADWDGLCCKIVGMPLAYTAEGRAFQAAAAMHQLQYAGGSVACFEGEDAGPALWAPWRILKQIAGEAYTSIEPETSEEGAP